MYFIIEGIIREYDRAYSIEDLAIADGTAMAYLSQSHTMTDLQLRSAVQAFTHRRAAAWTRILDPANADA